MLSRARSFISAYQDYLPVLFFIVGFVWDSLTLGRIDRLYDRVILCVYLVLLTVFIYLYNVADDGKWNDTFLKKYEKYFPLAIQFFLGGLCSAYVIYFSRSVSFTKTLSFFLILVGLLFANELLKKRISNKYLQFSAYFFMSFTFFSFFIPVLIKEMGTGIFIVSGLVSLTITVVFIIYLYRVSPSTRKEIDKKKLFGIITGLYLMIHAFYFLNLIPPVPLALETGIVAHDVEKMNGQYEVTYQEDLWYKFWRRNSLTYYQEPGSHIYVFTSIFAPTNLTKNIYHRWNWKNPVTGEWNETDKIGYEITGGRDEGYRGFTFKRNVNDGLWRVDVITEEGQILGIINFDVHTVRDGEEIAVVKQIL
jgi:hypothetical protein